MMTDRVSRRGRGIQVRGSAMKRDDALFRPLVILIALAGSPQAGVENIAKADPAEGSNRPGFQIRVRFGPDLEKRRSTAGSW